MLLALPCPASAWWPGPVSGWVRRAGAAPGWGPGAVPPHSSSHTPPLQTSGFKLVVVVTHDSAMVATLHCDTGIPPQVTIVTSTVHNCTVCTWCTTVPAIYSYPQTLGQIYPTWELYLLLLVAQPDWRPSGALGQRLLIVVILRKLRVQQTVGPLAAGRHTLQHHPMAGHCHAQHLNW